jgi:SOS regulatory protein LexA
MVKKSFDLRKNYANIFIMGLTKKQMEVYRFISQYTDEHGIAPTQREIKEHFGLKSFGSVQRYLNYLMDANLLERDLNARRGIALCSEGPSKSTQNESVCELPLLGLVAAGNPIEALENPDDHFPVPVQMIKSSHQHFALRVQGDSMIEDGILEDDIVIVRQTAKAEVGQTIVAVIDGDATLKKYFPFKDKIELRPANSRLGPITVGEDVADFKIVGKMVGLIRSYE